MQTKTMEFYETLPNKRDEEQSQMWVRFKEGYGTKFGIIGENRFSDFDMSNSDLQKLSRAIIDKLEGTPYAVSQRVSEIESHKKLEEFIKKTGYKVEFLGVCLDDIEKKSIQKHSKYFNNKIYMKAVITIFSIFTVIGAFMIHPIVGVFILSTAIFFVIS